MQLLSRLALQIFLASDWSWQKTVVSHTNLKRLYGLTCPPEGNDEYVQRNNLV